MLLGCCPFYFNIARTVLLFCIQVVIFLLEHFDIYSKPFSLFNLLSADRTSIKAAVGPLGVQFKLHLLMFKNLPPKLIISQSTRFFVFLSSALKSPISCLGMIFICNYFPIWGNNVKVHLLFGVMKKWVSFPFGFCTVSSNGLT